MADVPTKPYLVRAIVQWCNDAGFTPYVAVAVSAEVRVPPGAVKNGEIVLNISPMATHQLMMDNEAISFQARFSGVAREIYVPMSQVIAVYARENGQGMAFEVPQALKSGADTEVEAKERVPTHLRPVDALTQNTIAQLSEANDARSGDAPGCAVDEGSASDGGDPVEPPTPPTSGGERPKLKRIK